jgi:hypothetical protein
VLVIDVGNAISVVNGAEDINEVELFCVWSKVSGLTRSSALPDKSSSLSKNKCHFEYLKR